MQQRRKPCLTGKRTALYWSVRGTWRRRGMRWVQLRDRSVSLGCTLCLIHTSAATGTSRAHLHCPVVLPRSRRAVRPREQHLGRAGRRRGDVAAGQHRTSAPAAAEPARAPAGAVMCQHPRGKLDGCVRAVLPWVNQPRVSAELISSSRASFWCWS